MKSRWKKRYTFYLTIVLALFIFVVAALANRIFYVIDTGQAGVLYRFFSGTDIENVYTEGLMVVFPWNRVYIYDIREQKLTQSVQVLSFNGLNIEVVFSFRYRPDAAKLPILHQQLGPDYVEKVVNPLLIAAVREVIGNYRPEELYTTHSATIQQEVQRLCQRSIEEFNIRFSQILIQDINLPEKVIVAIEDKLVLQQEAEGYDFRLMTTERERLRKTVEAEGIRQYNRIISEDITEKLLQYQHIQSLKELSLSQNTKVVILEGGSHQSVNLPMFLTNDPPASSANANEKRTSTPRNTPRAPGEQSTTTSPSDSGDATSEGGQPSTTTEKGTAEQGTATGATAPADTSSERTKSERFSLFGGNKEKAGTTPTPGTADKKSPATGNKSATPEKNSARRSDATGQGGVSP